MSFRFRLRLRPVSGSVSGSVSRRSRRAFVSAPVAAVAAVVGILVVLAVFSVFEGLRRNRELAIRENLQTLWVAANQYFLDTGAAEVDYAELLKARPNVDSLADLKPVAGEDYAKVNKGKITRDAAELSVEYRDGKKTVETIYKTPK